MSYRTALKHLSFLALFFVATTLCAQNEQQEKMEQLSFLTGEWIGTSKVYENGAVARQCAAFEKIAYDLSGSILVIELNTEFLQLHTIVTFNEQDQKYYYHRFSKDGAAVYPAEFQDGQLIVWKNETTRFFFGATANGGFREYGEQLVDGAWTKTFEDTFINTQ